MIMKRWNKKVILLFSFIILASVGVFYFSDIVKAASTVTVEYDSNKGYTCFNKSTGAYVKSSSGSTNNCGSGNGRTFYKSIGDEDVYCVNWKLAFKEGSHTEVTSWKNSNKDAIMAGFLINHISAQGFNKAETYTKISAALNTLFARYEKDSNSYDFYSSNSEVKGYIDDALDYYNSVVKETSLPSISFSGNKVMNYDSTKKAYVSSKITASGFVKNYGGDADAVTYTIKATASNGDSTKTVKICTSSNATNCSNSVTLEDRSSSYPFYLYIDAAEVDTNYTITVKVSGSNNSTYYSSILYKSTNYDNAQKLIRTGTYSVSRKVSKSYVLTIPDLVNHKITAYKVDENGDTLKGASFSIYKDSTTGNPVVTNKNDNYIVTYTSGTTTEAKDDFFAHDYYLVETKAPDGFVLSNTTIPFYVKNTYTNKDNTVICYDENSTEVNLEYCNSSNYSYMCKNAAGDLRVTDDNHNCVAENEYNKVCYNSTVGVEADDSSYCNVDNATNYKYMCMITDESGNISYADVGEDGNCNDADGYTKVCYNNTLGEKTESLEYCNSGSYTYMCKDSDGDLSSLTSDGLCKFDKVCTNSDKKEVDSSYCVGGSYTKVEYSNGNIVVYQTNSKNVVNISKTDITGNVEVAGASLKICTKTDYESSNENCAAAKTIDDIEMSWTSGDSAYTIYGVPSGEYYIIETIAPNGYVKATTATEFSIDSEGKVVTSNKEITNDELKNGTAIVVNNDLTDIYISKRDIVTSEELPGATISICRTYKDEDGNYQMLTDQYSGDCIEAILADGSTATWVSTSEPHQIKGLEIGTYYLVERVAPTDYSTAESVLFTLNEDGTLSGPNGTIIEGSNKLIMYDFPIIKVQTGNLITYIVIGSLVLVALIGIGCYIYLKNTGKKVKK